MHAAVARGTTAAFAPSGDWLLTVEPLPPGAVDDLLARLAFRGSAAST